jgi:hypothetical protein
MRSRPSVAPRERPAQASNTHDPTMVPEDQFGDCPPAPSYIVSCSECSAIHRYVYVDIIGLEVSRLLLKQHQRRAKIVRGTASRHAELSAYASTVTIFLSRSGRIGAQEKYFVGGLNDIYYFIDRCDRILNSPMRRYFPVAVPSE